MHLVLRDNPTVRRSIVASAFVCDPLSRLSHVSIPKSIFSLKPKDTDGKGLPIIHIPD